LAYADAVPANATSLRAHFLRVLFPGEGQWVSPEAACQRLDDQWKIVDRAAVELHPRAVLAGDLAPLVMSSGTAEDGILLQR
jgi:hypothetical protein